MHTFDEGAKNMRLKFRFAQDARRGVIAILLLSHCIFLLKSIMCGRAYSRLRPTAIFLTRGTTYPHVASSHPPSAALTYYSSAYDRSFIKPESIYPQLDIDRSPRVIYNRHEVRRSRACRKSWWWPIAAVVDISRRAGYVYTDQGSAISLRTVIAGAFEPERHARKYTCALTHRVSWKSRKLGTNSFLEKKFTCYNLSYGCQISNIEWTLNFKLENF